MTRDACLARRRVVPTPEAPSGYSVALPSQPECFGDGETVAEAVATARDAMATGLDWEAAAARPEPDGIIVAGIDAAASERGSRKMRITGRTRPLIAPGRSLRTIRPAPAIRAGRACG
jgi:predicted RNase H-like HicB family nuclease